MKHSLKQLVTDNTAAAFWVLLPLLSCNYSDNASEQKNIDYNNIAAAQQTILISGSQGDTVQKVTVPKENHNINEVVKKKTRNDVLLQKKREKSTGSDIEIKTFNNTEGTEQTKTSAGWGYDIYISGALYIHQQHIPAVPGNMGFSTQEKAQKAGSLVVHKIRNNIMPPTISVEELDSLGVLK